MRKLLFMLFLCVHWIARGQNIYEYRYWFDGDETTAQTGTTTEAAWQMDLDISKLDATFHLLHFQAKDTADVWSAPITRGFVKQPIPRQCKYRLWVDEDAATMQEGIYTGSPIELNVADISEGFHLLRAQVEGSADSSPLTSMFIKVPQTQGIEYLTAIFLLDGKAYKQEKLPTEGGIIKWIIDASGIPHGLHKVQAMVVTPTGAATGVKDAFFYRAMTTEEKANMRCFYSIDGSEHKYEAGKVNKNLYHFDLNVTDVEDGFHRISYMLMGENGTSSKVMSAFFFKTALGGNGVKQYEYWLNENEENMHRVKLEQRENPFKLISLLPVETCPIRSSCFHFEVENNQPVIYAKNDFHLRFFDTVGRLTEASKAYVDYNVSQAVTDIEPITDMEGVYNCDKPEENGIMWFKMDAKVGDSLSIKTSQAATLQIFSPTGKEVYTASGAESVSFSGCHAYEDGTYYIALHDVKGTTGTTIDFHYQHIDKYAVLKWTPREAGAAIGYMYMDLLGNGFDKLKRITLTCENDSIKSDSIITEGLSLATAQFFIDSYDKVRGQYNMVLEFEAEGVKEFVTITKAIKLVDPVYGDIKIDISSQRRTAKPYPVTIEIINTGNIAYQMIPLFIAYDNPELITEVSGLNFSRDGVGDSAVVDTTSFRLTDNLLNKGINGRYLSTIIPNLHPNDTLRLQVGFIGGGHTRFNMYAWHYKPWGTYLTDMVSPANALLTKSMRTPPPICEIDPCEIAEEVAPQWAQCICGIGWGDLSMIGGVYGALMNNTYRQRDNIYQEMAGDLYESPYRRAHLPSPGGIIRDVLERCTGIPSEALTALENAINGGAMDDCPNPNPNPVELLMPGDPNDIKGYTSTSGSKFIAKDIVDSYYAIEFENDPKIANAAAHHIVIKDTLDAKYFDLSSFKPTGIKFGSRDIMLDGEQSFVRTIDLRPATNVIAQLSLDYDAKKGIATWDFQSLDPMTMEITDDAMQGILPVNNDAGDGQGEVTFDIKFREGFADGIEVPNRAAIIFDQEKPIITPTWTNMTDTVAPKSEIAKSERTGDSSVKLYFKGTDNRSGIWRYDLYMQDGVDAAWNLVAENVEDSVYEYNGHAGFNYGFCVMATDSAGNKEVKTLEREASQITYKPGDANSDGVVDMLDATLAQGKYLGKEVYLNFEATDVNEDRQIDTLDVTLIQQTYLSTGSQKTVKRKRIKIKRKQ